MSHVCPQEPAPHTGAVHCHPSAVWSLGGQRGPARGSFYLSPNPVTLMYWGTPGPSRQCQHKLTHRPPKALWVPPPSLPESGRLPHSYPPGSLRKGSPAITVCMDSCFISGDGVRWECHPRLNPVPNLIDFYTEGQLRIAQVAFMYLYKMILKRFKEHPFCTLVCPLPLA